MPTVKPTLQPMTCHCTCGLSWFASAKLASDPVTAQLRANEHSTGIGSFACTWLTRSSLNKVSLLRISVELEG